MLALVVLIFALIAAPAAAWWSRAPLIVQELVEALQSWRDAALSLRRAGAADARADAAGSAAPTR